MQGPEPTGLQLRAARGALGLSVRELSERTGVGTATIVRYENEESVPRSRKGHLATLERFFEAAGIEFIGTPEEGPGIRLWSVGQR